LSEVLATGHNRPRYGNYLYGSFGIDFRLRDGNAVMVVALTKRQWTDLVKVTGAGRLVDALIDYLRADFATNAARFENRELLASILRPWFKVRTLAEVEAAFAGTGVMWSAYRSVSDLVAAVADGQLPTSYLWDDVSVGRNVATEGPIRVSGSSPLRAAAPSLGEHTGEVLDALAASAESAVRGSA
jgi:2-methylfumaryl-CoA isomerase